jgi:hypothetical protein
MGGGCVQIVCGWAFLDSWNPKQGKKEKRKKKSAVDGSLRWKKGVGRF